MSILTTNNLSNPTIVDKKVDSGKMLIKLDSNNHWVSFVISKYHSEGLPNEYFVNCELLNYAKLLMINSERSIDAMSRLLVSLRAWVLRRSELFVDNPDVEVQLLVCACEAFSNVKCETGLYYRSWSNIFNYKRLYFAKNFNVPWLLDYRFYLLLLYFVVLVIVRFQYFLILLFNIFGILIVCFAVVFRYFELLTLLGLIYYFSLKKMQVNHSPIPKLMSVKPVSNRPIISKCSLQVDDLAYVDGDVKLPPPSAIVRRPTECKSSGPCAFSEEVQILITSHLGTIDLLPSLADVSYIAPKVNGKHKFIDFPCLYYTGNVSNVEENCTIKMIRMRSEPMPSFYRLVGPAFVGILPGVHANVAKNEYASLVMRHMKTTPVCKNREDWLEASRLAFEALEPKEGKRYSVEEWINTQDPSKQKKYRKFLDQADNLDFKDKRFHDRCFFIKRELLVPTREKSIKLKVPRGIQGLLRPCANMALGPLMLHISDCVKNPLVSPYKKVHFTSGCTPDQLGDWYHYVTTNGYHIYEDDFTEYDASQGLGAWLCEEKFYSQFHLSEKERFALNEQRRTVGKGKYYKYSCSFTRKSGDQNTSLGNTYINVAVHCFALNQLKIVDYLMLAVGDDNILAVKGEKDSFMNDMAKIVSDFGLKPKFSKNFVPSYCSGNFMPVLRQGKPTHIFVPDLFRFLCKCGWTSGVMGKGETTDSRMKGNMLSQPAISLMPILRVLYQHYTGLKCCATYDTTKVYSVHCKQFDVKDYESCSATYQWFTRAYELTYDECSVIEQFLAKHLVDSAGMPSAWGHHLVAKSYQLCR